MKIQYCPSYLSDYHKKYFNDLDFQKCFYHISLKNSNEHFFMNKQQVFRFLHFLGNYNINKMEDLSNLNPQHFSKNHKSIFLYEVILRLRQVDIFGKYNVCLKQKRFSLYDLFP